MNTNIGAKRARQARDRWGLPDDEPLPCVVAVAEHCEGLHVIVASLRPEIAGALHPSGLVWVNGDQGPMRCRFTVAHELGHRCCGHEAPTVDSPQDLSAPGTAHEVQANAFAAEVLAPRRAVEAMVEGTPTLEDVVRVAVRFGISYMAARYRLVTLGLATQARAELLAREQEEGLHRSLVEQHEEPLGDLLAELGPHDLPRLPPSLRGSVLHRLVAGELTLEEAAAAAGVPVEALGEGLAELLG